MSNDGRRSSATKTSPEQSCQRNRNNNHPIPKTSQSYPKLSKEIYIELAAFSDSIYDRGRLLEKYVFNIVSKHRFSTYKSTQTVKIRIGRVSK